MSFGVGIILNWNLEGQLIDFHASHVGWTIQHQSIHRHFDLFTSFSIHIRMDPAIQAPFVMTKNRFCQRQVRSNREDTISRMNRTIFDGDTISHWPESGLLGRFARKRKGID